MIYYKTKKHYDSIWSYKKFLSLWIWQSVWYIEILIRTCILVVGRIYCMALAHISVNGYSFKRYKPNNHQVHHLIPIFISMIEVCPYLVCFQLFIDGINKNIALISNLNIFSQSIFVNVHLIIWFLKLAFINAVILVFLAY